MSSHNAFLQAIIDNPDDDTLRLIYADWLEGQGDTARAEFIRIQCELARMNGCEFAKDQGGKRCEQTFRPYSISCHWCLLRKREKDLFYEHMDQWFDSNCIRFPRLPGERAFYRNNAGQWRPDTGFTDSVCRRGFIDGIKCFCQEWLERGADMLRAYPTIREVRLSGRKPQFENGRFFWLGDDNDWWQGTPDRLPYEIYEHLRKKPEHGWLFVFYDTAKDACTDLSQACIAFAQTQLKLTSR